VRAIVALTTQPYRGGNNHLALKPAQHITESDALERREAEIETTPDSVEALSLARGIVDLASDKQASDIVLLDIRGVSLIADYFVICTVGSERQAAAILKDLSSRLLEEFGRKPLHTEGKPDSGWVLLDYGDVILHVFSPAQRNFYNLEQLWAAATPIVRLQ
jgi:ribosome-associated protein